ncbi:MAG: hypothetical protein BWK73_49655 [Thiothrix lacustris]|uniref:Growth inhibitor PemK n=1 Tax=Thiothrix lacustris TaxID=525917 RepID=A0A1Y1Q8V2_9GAMM|nr:MAG: hypothetical protein BWK73_49655 [Thiothrix lacustris]
MACKAGEIAVIPFPFADLSSTKKRPVLVLTAPDSNGDFVCLAVTSQGYHDGAVLLEQGGMLSGSLPKTSWVRTDKVFTLSATMIIKTVGQVQAALLGAAINGLCNTIKP